jgi:lactoylglutathione lyase
MNAFLGLRTTIYKVNDLAAAKEWYAKAFMTPPYFDEEFYVGFNIAGYELGLLPGTEADNEKTANIISYWGIENIDDAYQHMLECGATTFEKPECVGENLWVASVKDPWGNVIGLIDNPHFKLG